MLQRLIARLDAYREVAFDLIRIYLGIGLFVRGILFAYDADAFVALLPAGAPAWLAEPSVLTTVAFVHMIGGLLIAVGYWTRFATLAQIPILFGAVFISIGGLFSPDQSFELSALVLLLLVLVLICGSGKWSIDYAIGERRPSIQLVLDRIADYRATAFDLLRMYLGVALFLRGVVFISDADTFMALLGNDSAGFLRSAVLVHYVALGHVFGGFMMAAGLLTRVAALVQIPILVGAVVVSQMQGGLMAGTQGFEISALTLFLLMLVLLYGSGQWSADHYLLRRPAPATRQERAVRAAEILSHAVPEEGPFVDPVEILAVPEARTDAAIAEALKDNPLVVTHARYPFWGWLLFLLDVTPRPREVIFRHMKTGKIIKRSKDPEVLRQFRYR